LILRTILPFRRDQQMHVIGHQAVCVNLAAMPCRLFSQVLQEAAVVSLTVKTGRAINTALDNMPGDTRYGQTCSSRQTSPPGPCEPDRKSQPGSHQQEYQSDK